jgi:competence protein ComEC
MAATDPPVPAIHGFQAPGAVVLVLFLLGLGAARLTPLAGWGVLAGGMAGLLTAGAVALVQRRRGLAMMALALAFVAGGAALEVKEHQRFVRLRIALEPLRARLDSGMAVRVEGVTKELPRPGPAEGSVEANLQVDTVWVQGEPEPLQFPALLRVYHPAGFADEWRRGDRVQAMVRLSLPRGFRNRGSLPSYLYYWNRNSLCLASCKSPGLVVILAPGTEGLLDGLHRRLAGRIERLAGTPETAEVLQALLLGRRVAAPELREAYIDAGVYHLLVISGAHLTLLAVFLGLLLAIARIPPRWRAWFLIPLLAVYVGFVQGQVAVMRAFLIVLLFLVGGLFDRRSELLNSTAWAALLLLAVNPWWIADPGFQLTFGAVFALALAGAPLNRYWAQPLALARRDLFSARVDLSEGVERIRGRRLRFRIEEFHFFWLAMLPVSGFRFGARGVLGMMAWILRALLATVAVLLVTVPILASLHVPVPLAGVLFSPAALVLIWPILVALVGAAATASWPVLSDGLIRLAAALADGLNRLVVSVNAVPVWVPPLGAILAAVYLLLLMWLLRGRRARPGWAVATGILLLVGVQAVPPPRPAQPRIALLDVGEGEAILVRSPGGQNLLVDTGGLAPMGPLTEEACRRGDLSRRVLVPVLLESGIRRLDALVLSHLDFDHAGSAAGLMRIFPVAAVYAPSAEWARAPAMAARLAAAAADRKIPLRFLSAGDRLEFDPLRLRVLHPPLGAVDMAGNRNSLVLLGEGAGASFLLTGDIDTSVENALLRAGAVPPIALLKAAHHGSRTSSGAAFLDAVRPVMVVISSGPPERFSHPSPVVLDRLDRLGIPHVTTHTVGQIEVVFDPPGPRLEFPAPPAGPVR